jgi:N-methylhydantoinase A
MALVAYGGAGPLLAADVADETGCPIVIVPPAPGTLCARGILMSDPSRDFVETVLAPAETGWAQATAAFDRMSAMAHAWLTTEAPDPARRQIERSIEARYIGQSFEAATPVYPDDSVDEFIERFHAAHKLEHGYEIRARGVEIVNCRLIATSIGMKSTPARVTASGPGSAAGTTRNVAFTHADGGVADVETTVLQRDGLQPHEVIVGPAIIVEKTSTTVVPPDWSAVVDDYANLILRR